MKRKNKMIKWIIKNVYCAKEPYYSTNDDEQCQHLNVEEWTTTDFKKALEIIKDFLDVPLAKVTNEQVKMDFNFPNITEEQVVGIVNYYNGRLAIWEYAEKELKDHVLAGALDNVFCYEIPEKYSSFEAFNENTKKVDFQMKVEVHCQNM